MLVSKKELLNQKLQSIGQDRLKELAKLKSLKVSGTTTDLIKRLLGDKLPMKEIDNYITKEYAKLIKERQTGLISDNDLKKELAKLTNLNWGTVQGQLDNLIQVQYVRKFVHYHELIKAIKDKLRAQIQSYVLATWYNHWTTVLIEDHISQHKKVIPTLKNNFGVDIFFDGQPFDLKVTYLPKGYDKGVKHAIKNPQDLAVWMYENQGGQRFGDDNRLFVILADTKNLGNSWKLKRDFDYIFNSLDKFFDSGSVSTKDEITFGYKRKTYTAITKVLFITK